MSSNALAVKLAEKKQELRNLQQIQGISKDLVKELEDLSNNFDSLADGTEVVAKLMSNWTSILKSLQLASTSLAKYSEEDYDKEAPVEEKPLPETLVRIRVDK